MSSEEIMQIVLVSLIAIVGITIIVLIVLAITGSSKKKNQSGNTNTADKQQKSSANKKQATVEQIKRESIFKFMDFDDVSDNMIVRKDKKEYVMVLQCKGINFDLMSENEKIAVEEGFMQFLNTLRYPIQLYVQTRSLDLSTGINEYKQRTSEIEKQIYKLQEQAREEEKNGNSEKAELLRYQERNKKNVLEYGQDIINYISRMSLNKNVLQQRTFIIIKYTKEELGDVELSNEEIQNLIFSELYTRAQTLISAIYSTGVEARVLNSEELVELLYVAYNRDDADLINFEKAIEMQYDSLYKTGEDILDKKKKQIEKEVQEEAINLVNQATLASNLKYSIQKSDKDKKEEVLKRALQVLEQYKDQFDKVVYNSTILDLYEMAHIKYESKSESEEKIENEKPQKKRTVKKSKISNTNE